MIQDKAVKFLYCSNKGFVRSLKCHALVIGHGSYWETDLSLTGILTSSGVCIITFLTSRVDWDINYIFGILMSNAIDWFINESILSGSGGGGPRLTRDCHKNCRLLLSSRNFICQQDCWHMKRSMSTNAQHWCSPVLCPKAIHFVGKGFYRWVGSDGIDLHINGHTWC